jgi:predicted AlkP superfamily phosphohydrolase/phosphomutase
MPRAQPKILLIGLDAGDRELIEQWEREGALPNIARLRATGMSAALRTTAEVLHVSAWPSIFTGTTPDKHGLYHAYVMQQGEQAPVRPRPESCPVPFLWKMLDAQGKRCIVIDAFLTCPLRDMSGVQIVDWGSWTHFCRETILPPSLGAEIASRFGAYPAEDHSKVGMTPPADPRGFRDRLLAAVERKRELAQWLMQSQPWDFFLVVFGECHPAGHYFWHFHDSAYPSHPREAHEMRSALRDIYVALDRAIGELTRTAGEDVMVCVVSGDGMGPNYSGSHLLAPLLERMRLLNDPGDTSRAAPKSRRDLFGAARDLIPKPLRALVSRTLLPRSVNEKLALRKKTAGISWERTRAFAIDNANEGFIRVNLKGRDPQGTVEPGAEFQSLCDVLAETASSLVNPFNARRAAHAVFVTDELFHGPCRHSLPDLVITWNPQALISTQVTGERCGLVQSEHAAHELMPYYSGNHRPNAFAIFTGPQVPAGRVVEGASILDLAPTFLAHFGIAAPAYMDGATLRELAPAAELDVIR